MRKVVLTTAFALCQLVSATAQDRPAAMKQGQMDRLDLSRQVERRVVDPHGSPAPGRRPHEPLAQAPNPREACRED